MYVAASMLFNVAGLDSILYALNNKDVDCYMHVYVAQEVWRKETAMQGGTPWPQVE